jgi:hypothetical protein
VATHPAVDEVVISVEEEAFGLVSEALSDVAIRAHVRCCNAADNLADSVIAAARGHSGPIIVTTADNPLLTWRSLDAVLDGLKRAEAALAITRREAVVDVHPLGQLRFYRFRCGEYSNCNLYGLASPRALNASEIFRGGGQFAKKARRIVETFGLINLLLLRLRLLSLADGFRRISRRMGVRVEPVILDDGSQAIDVDDDRTYAIVKHLLERRADGRRYTLPVPTPRAPAAPHRKDPVLA